MTDVPDDRLLEQFARNGSEAAFAALVQRHIPLVHSVALRHTANPQHAQDITQAVFIILARKAGALGHKTVLPGWLYHTARLTAANLQRAETCRVRREQEAFMQSKLEESPTDNLWSELSPQLDEAMAGLGTSERDALVLRYFQNKSMAEVAKLLGLEENTAQKRVSRALEKLRKFFTKRGVDSTTAGIAENLSAHSVQAVPVTLAKSVTAVALAKGATASISTLTLIKGALKIMAWTKAKTVIVVGVVAILATGPTIVTVKQIQNHVRNREIATALLEMHHQWATNDYRAKGMKVPPMLDNRNVHSYGVGLYGAAVEYIEQKDGIEWSRSLGIIRADTNSTTWTLYERGDPTDTNLLKRAWMHQNLTIVKGEP